MACSNHGWALLPLGSNGWDFALRAGATPPQLTVTFVPPAAEEGSARQKTA